MKKRIVLLIISLFLILGLSQALFAKQQSWKSWVAQLRHDAIAEGISPAFFDRIFKTLKIGKRQLRLDRTQPERRLTFLQYRKTRIDAFRIRLGRSKFKKNKKLLTAISDDYGVDPCIIASIWGLETSYGHYMGSFPVVQSLATLAHDGRRSAFFRKELLLALKIVYHGHITLAKFKGEWAGASGHGQFLPSSWYEYAVDHNGDGKKNIWTHLGDALASMANYLHSNGWHNGQPWGVQVKVTRSIPKDKIGKQFKQTVSAWEKMGVKIKSGSHLPSRNLDASLVEPYGGPSFLVFHNFKVIGTYNPSLFYGLSVGYLADKICHRA